MTAATPEVDVHVGPHALASVAVCVPIWQCTIGLHQQGTKSTHPGTGEQAQAYAQAQAQAQARVRTQTTQKADYGGEIGGEESNKTNESER